MPVPVRVPCDWDADQGLRWQDKARDGNLRLSAKLSTGTYASKEIIIMKKNILIYVIVVKYHILTRILILHSLILWRKRRRLWRKRGSTSQLSRIRPREKRVKLRRKKAQVISLLLFLFVQNLTDVRCIPPPKKKGVVRISIFFFWGGGF